MGASVRARPPAIPGRLEVRLRTAALALSIVVNAAAAFAQGDGLLVQNPLDEIRDSLAQTLEAADVPFTDAQVEEIALVMDEQRRATEDLFGQVFNFSGGPPQGQQLDRALAGIAWMTDRFLEAVDTVLTSAQQEAWMAAREAGTVPERARLDPDAIAESGGGSSSQIAQIRINNNPYTAESRAFRNEVITRGGIGDFHGNVNFTFQNHLLNARNPFAGNRPEYLQRTLDAGFNGPVVPGRLTLNVNATQNNIDNVDTISAVTPEGLVSEGITRPTLFRNFGLNGQLYVSERQALHFDVNQNLNRRTNNGIGGITLRERALDNEFTSMFASVRSLTQLSADTVLDVTVNRNRVAVTNEPATRGVAINVRDAFRGGGATNEVNGSSRTFNVNSLLIHTRGPVTIKAGADVSRERLDVEVQNQFNGLFEFASLDDYLAGTPTTYTVSRGEPRIAFPQTQAALFLQNDVRISSRLTLMFGLRYEAQTNLDDRSNFDPRLGYAYAIDDATVLRGGLGLFHDRLGSNTVQTLLLLDGTRQQEIVVRNPSYPNPFLSGETEVVPPSSIRVRSPDLQAPLELRGQISLERQLPGNVQATLTYGINRTRNQLRSVNLNAPRPGETERPDPSQGNILELRSTGRETRQEIGLSVQQRLRLFTVSGNYQWTHEMNDSQGAFSLPADNYDLAADWGRGNARVHFFNASVNAQLPLGIFMTVRVQARSGQPWTITTGRDDNGDTESNDRPPGVPRNSETGPGFRTTNVNLSKVFYLRRNASDAGRAAGGAGMQVNVFANITNALNRSNFQSVSGALTSKRFGQPTSAGDPREIQIGVRFQF